jgi:hypothetical protein
MTRKESKRLTERLLGEQKSKPKPLEMKSLATPVIEKKQDKKMDKIDVIEIKETVKPKRVMHSSWPSAFAF